MTFNSVKLHLFLKNAKKIPTPEPNTATNVILNNILMLCKKEANNLLNLRDAIMTCKTIVCVSNIQNKKTSQNQK